MTPPGLPEPVLAAVVQQCACGLAHLHARSLVHRDLKPANILVDANRGVCALADFGIATEVDPSGMYGGLASSFVGTAAYMAPERLNGQQYSAPADMWSLGMIVVELAEGAHPWRDATSYYDLVLELSSCGTPPRLPSDDGRFSQPLVELAASCLEPAPDAYSSFV